MMHEDKYFTMNVEDMINPKPDSYSLYIYLDNDQIDSYFSKFDSIVLVKNKKEYSFEPSEFLKAIMMCEDIDKIKQENEKLKYLVSKMYPICMNKKRCTFADRLYIVEMVDELDIDVNTINAFEPMYNVVKTEPYSTRKTIMDKIVDKAIEKINEQRSMNADQEGT